MTNWFSEKIKVVSFLAIVVVFFFHAGYPEEVYQIMTVPVIVRNSTAGIFGPLAVPMFYTISGYLFFLGCQKGLADIWRKIKKRVRTLFIPFIIAALFFPLFFIGLELIPGFSSHINGVSYIERIRTMNMPDILIALFGDDGKGSPWAYHLWFLRDEIVLVALSPILYLLRKYIHYWSVAVIVTLYFVLPKVGIFYAMYWFVLGSFVLDKMAMIPRYVVYVMLGVFLAMAVYHQCYEGAINRAFGLVDFTLGGCSLWCLYDCVVPSSFCLGSHPWLNKACQFTFFCYLYHEPFLHLFVKGIPIALGANWYGFTLSYILPPLIITPILIWGGQFLKNKCAPFYKVISGGR